MRCPYQTKKTIINSISGDVIVKVEEVTEFRACNDRDCMAYGNRGCKRLDKGE